MSGVSAALVGPSCWITSVPLSVGTTCVAVEWDELGL